MTPTNATTVETILVAQTTPGAEIAARLGLKPQRPLALVMGGAADLSAEDGARLARQVHEGLGPALQVAGAAVIDGGTDAGIMGMLNAALGRIGFSGPYIGVAPAGVTYLPGELPNEDTYPFGLNHTHIVQVEGQEFGDEREPMFSLAAYLASGQRSLGILVNGGKGTQKEALENVRQGREVVVLRGSGRLADEIAAALDAPQQARPDIRQLITLGRFTPFDLRNPPNFLLDYLARKLAA
ncbi:MAG: hypothetical protein EPO32_05905 [Anaerolineae bacterium]|nr:MAG: hypothetical protein EPO32_05905 [Anaerolineae bacterium]